MKKINFVSLLAITVIILGACSSSTTTNNETDETCVYQLDKKYLRFIWTAYKFTEKKGVPGTFDDITVNTSTDAENMDDLLRSISFTINTNSINSKDPARDVKVSHFFFGTMSKTEEISGTIKSISGTDAVVALTLNDLTLDIPGNLTFSGDTIQLSSTVDFKAFGADEALAKLNEVCSEEHSGEDGESVFWSVVDINVKAIYSKTCK